MEHHSFHNPFERRTFISSNTPAVKWFKEWVPQDVVATGGRCSVMRWITEAQLNAMKEKSKEVEAIEPEPEPTTEVLFLCSYEGCGKTFIDAGALRKHAHIHGERQYVCHYENCGKKFLDSSKLKRHFLIHTGERDFVCPHEGCGKNNNNMMVEAPLKYVHIQPIEKPPPKAPKASTATYASASSDRPYACPYEGCEKAYIHEYKLNLHLRREHPGHFPEENPKNAHGNNEMDVGSDHDGNTMKREITKSQKQNRPKPNVKLPPAKVVQRKVSTAVGNVIKKQLWPVVKDVYEEEDSEETEEDRDNVEDRWGYGDNNNDEDDDEETEYED
ncbi:zinc finger transcription factor YY1-like isoform X4 [Cynara cardunculus var. scolymus]|uniref:zinc finger transcription factor YY1-like isoform X4 n=1 Tax=Cynara cardunculus var. scolymus TaxID=59895 RepID=UPI000D62DAFB|nr:zinc finger transcription factor YY1-like isoform X4 [Cynara cardunculus var. scolymus]